MKGDRGLAGLALLAVLLAGCGEVVPLIQLDGVVQGLENEDGCLTGHDGERMKQGRIAALFRGGHGRR